ncbi:MAG: hypothetical protein GFH27_549287n222 [Chloroflexi bacterium AL-W]|nr:hypothetical protein [Chloroflexi bacterium AL-N1]NOK66496.1 hypothetical protein [Chloroflexi bacterium AL-N10]NOK71884.1 hypothetical protein [Chloroflexi bacterium AL-N5]NOK81141.1 hypothetical protein [Chloroflexi bacterium AL-W]NOK89414.1 hypothetical protein [Chloroflexi bacterium AL-N15]
MIEIKIANHIEVAKKRSLVANIASIVAPDTLKFKVEQIIATEIKRILQERGIEVAVSIKQGG